jgi:2-polyprenyl-3-methyl-5-hydroxy-6-metoxy-1,4-benzoquinol methylase
MSAEDYDAWRRPDAVVALLGLGRESVVADVGAGTGYLTRRLCAAAGRVVATEIDAASLAQVPACAEKRLVEPDDPGLEAATYDVVLLAQVDHLLPDRAAWLARARAALRPGGRIVVANRVQHRARLMAALDAAGLRVASESELPGQFVMVLQ